MDFKINIFALHYFLWFAALTSIYGYISVYATHYANSTPSQYGLLNMILPFVTIVAKLAFCSLADRHRAYRKFFIGFLATSLIGFGSFGVMPFFVTPQPKELGLNHVTWSLICLMTTVSIVSMSVMSCLSDAFAMNSSKKNNSSYGYMRVWGTLGWGASSVMISIVNQDTHLPFLVPGLLLTIALLVLDLAATIYWPNKEDFSLEKSAKPNIQFEEILSGISNERASKCAHNEVPESNELTSDLSSNQYGTSIGTESVEVQVRITDPEPPSSNPSTLNSSGLDSKLIMARKGLHVESEPMANELSDISDIRIQWLLFKGVAKRRKSLFHYMTLFTVSGALISLQWSYFFLYLEKIYTNDFAYISGLSMVSQSMLGELPFFILSSPVIEYLGKSDTLSLSIISLGVRYLLYQHLLPISSMYFVLLTEAFQGPSFGLFYVVMTEVGLEYSDCEDAILDIVRDGKVAQDPQTIKKLRQALRATMQSLMSACYEGLGLGVGAIIGGVVIDYLGFNVLWTWSSIVAIAMGLANIVISRFISSDV